MRERRPLSPKLSFMEALEQPDIEFDLEHLKNVCEPLSENNLSLEEIFIKTGNEVLAFRLLNLNGLYEEVSDAWKDVCKMKGYMSGNY